jgi:S-adenosylmethionine synthetase
MIKKGEKEMGKNYLFTSESVTSGHPDKMCDMISDAILDAYLTEDLDARVACEVTATTGFIMVLGEITSNAVIDIQKVVRDTVNEIGYDNNSYGFDGTTCAVVISLDQQSEDINRGVDGTSYVSDTESSSGRNNTIDKKELMGAGDQGMMFGYACNETDEYMPAPIYYAHKLSKKLSEVREKKELPYLGPDGKSMVTFRYELGKPVSVNTIVVSTQHTLELDQKHLKEDIINHVIKPVIPKEYLNECKILVNPTGRFLKGGPCADTGLTGRKIIVDTYGGMGRHGGGAFSGKDPSKVDRTGAYAARYVAKHIVALGLAEKCEVQISYAIGVSHPVSVYVDTFGTGQFSNEELIDMIESVFDLRPAALIEAFELKRPIYKQTASYGHFGRNELDLPWEKTDKSDEIKKYFGSR